MLRGRLRERQTPVTDDGAWRQHLIARTEQALEDLAATGTSAVSFVRHARASSASDVIEALAERARARGFVSAVVDVSAERALDAFDELVRAILRAAMHQADAAPGRHKAGLAGILDAFVASHADDPAGALEAALEAARLDGELARISRAYVAASPPPRAAASRPQVRVSSPARPRGGGEAVRAARMLDAWLTGVELSRVEPADDGAPVALGERTAKRVLVDFTRLVRALGHRGTFVALGSADVLSTLPPARRRAAYTVLRELVDDADGGRGMTAAHVIVAGSTSLFVGPRSIASLPPLAARIGNDEETVAGEAPPPHRPVVDLSAPGMVAAAIGRARAIDAPDARTSAALAAVIRASRGLPPVELARAISVGHQRIDRAIDALFEHSNADGSVFALLVGEYGTGKTHFMLHLAARALADRRAVLRLPLEQLDADLGHPERHVRRLVEHASVWPNGESALDRARAWTADAAGMRAIEAALADVAASSDDASHAAQRAVTVLARARRPQAALLSFLSAEDLATKTPSPSARREAYARLLLWLALFERIDGCAGPVLLIDEAESLYAGGASRPERRTALRSLSFYCGGALPRACVVLAVTPVALAELAREAPTLLEDVAEQRTLLPWEDAAMLCRRISRTPALPVPVLGRADRVRLAERLRELHEIARGPLDDPAWPAFVERLAASSTPREVMRRAADRLERLWWSTTSRSSDSRARSRAWPSSSP